jgi:hypothetical protein
MDKIEIEVGVRSDGQNHRVDLEVANYRSDEVVVRLIHPLPEGLVPSGVSPLSGSLADSWSVSGDGVEFVHGVEWASAIQTGYVARGVDRTAIEAAFERATVEVGKPDGREIGTLTGIEPYFSEAVSLGPSDDGDASGNDEGDSSDPEAAGEADSTPGEVSGTDSAGDTNPTDGAGFGPDQPWESPVVRSEPGDGPSPDDREVSGDPAPERETGSSVAPGGARDTEVKALPANVSAYVFDGLPDELSEAEFSWTDVDGEEPSTESGGTDDGEASSPSSDGEGGGLLKRVRSWF